MEAGTSARIRPTEKPVDINAARALKKMLTYTLLVWKLTIGLGGPCFLRHASLSTSKFRQLFNTQTPPPREQTRFDAGCVIQERKRALTMTMSLDLEKMTYYVVVPTTCQASDLRFSQMPCNVTRLKAETRDN